MLNVSLLKLYNYEKVYQKLFICFNLLGDCNTIYVMVFELKIWFRYNSGNDKDFEHYRVEALNVHEAFKKIKNNNFIRNRFIPISYERIINGVSDGNVYKPSHSEINDWNFEKPLSELNKEY